MQAIPMTLRGAEKLREELDYLKSVRRPEIIAAIAEAREHGDLKENAEYHAAREQQGFCEGRIKDIEAKLSNAQVIDITQNAEQRPGDFWFYRQRAEPRYRRGTDLPHRGR
ncbi:transcription elongation factor GreA [Klebsiella pneumoniae]|uniref:Transcription elongation factor GreA n=1 Tax=Klebsiella pneumoniae TaxID=573 RepID=A0A377U352_KLEPN|nr:transcription elongation factor GreA [Klebsiella pneumoniae]